MPKLTHPDTDRVIEVAASHVEAYVSQGWAPAKSPAEKKPKK